MAKIIAKTYNKDLLKRTRDNLRQYYINHIENYMINTETIIFTKPVRVKDCLVLKIYRDKAYLDFSKFNELISIATDYPYTSLDLNILAAIADLVEKQLSKQPPVTKDWLFNLGFHDYAENSFVYKYYDRKQIKVRFSDNCPIELELENDWGDEQTFHNFDRQDIINLDKLCLKNKKKDNK